MEGSKVKTYVYKSTPRNVTVSLDENGKPNFGNIMYDPRVVRGNTWAMRRMARDEINAKLLADRQENRKKRHLIRKQIKEKLEMGGNLIQPPTALAVARGRTPDPVFPNVPLETPPYYTGPLIPSKSRAEIRGRSTKESRTPPSTPSTVKNPMVDRAAQVSDELDTSLNFAAEVLIESVLTDAVRELDSEQRLSEVKKQKKQLELKWQQDLEKINKLQETIKIADEHKSQLMIERSLLEKRELSRLANQISREYVNEDLIPNVLAKMDAKGILKPKVQKESVSVDTKHLEAQTILYGRILNDIMLDFLPWIYTKASMTAEHDMLDMNLRDALFCSEKDIRKKAASVLGHTLHGLPE